MDGRSIQKLRLEKRLIRRRNWIAPKDLEKALNELPDVSHKIAEVDSDDDDRATEEAPSE
jgi:hypothetical protein